MFLYYTSARHFKTSLASRTEAGLSFVSPLSLKVDENHATKSSMGNGFSFTSTMEGSCLEVALTKKAKNPEVKKKNLCLLMHLSLANINFDTLDLESH